MMMPRVSMAAIMAALVVIAVDCVVFRSIWARPYDAGLMMVALGTLPMANLLAVVAARLVAGDGRPRRFLASFLVGGGCALLASAWWMPKIVAGVALALMAAGLGWRAGGTSIPITILSFACVIVVPLLGQVAVGLVVGLASRLLGGRSSPTPPSPAPGRLPARSYLVLVVLVMVPVLVVEGILYVRVDRPIARLAVGSEATIELEDAWGVNAFTPDPIDHSRVRIEADRAPHTVELLHDDWLTQVRDYRPVQVMLLDGPMAGQSTQMVYYMLRPARQGAGPSPPAAR